VVDIPLPGPDGTVAALLNTVEDLTDVVAERSRAERDRLAAHDLRSRTEQSLGALGADGGAVAVLDGSTRTIQLTMMDSLGPDTPRIYGDLTLDGPLPASVSVSARTGRPVLVGDREAGLAFSPAMAQGVPGRRQRGVGVAAATGGRPGSGVHNRQLGHPSAVRRLRRRLLRALAAQCALALDRLLSRDAERAAAAATARLSEALQRSLLTDPVQPDHLQVAVRYVPAGAYAEVGGDWYDAFLTRDGSTSLVNGDVTGHDRDAAASMAQVRNVLRGIAHALVEPPAVVLSLLDLAMTNLAIGAPTTAVLAMVEQTEEQVATGERTLHWSNAGHPPSLLLSPDGEAVLLQRPTDLLLGVFAAPPRSTVVLYSHGLFERRGVDLDESLEWLRATAARLGGLPLEGLCDAPIDGLEGGGEDDVAVLAVRAHPQDRPRPAEAGSQVLPEELVVDRA